MDRENLQGRYVITAVDCVSSTTLTSLQKSKVGFKLDRDTPMGYYERLGSLLISLAPYKNQESIVPPNNLELEVSDFDLRREIEARAFSLVPMSDDYEKIKFSPKTLEGRLRGTLVDIILDNEENIIPHFIYQEAQEPVEDRQLKFYI